MPMDGTFEDPRSAHKVDLFMKKPIALIGCAHLFSQRVQRALRAEFSQQDVNFFDTLNAARTYSGDTGPIACFDLLILDAPTFIDLMRDTGMTGTVAEGVKLAVAYDNDAVLAHLLDLYREAIFTRNISLLPMHATLEAWLCMLGLVGSGMQFVPASASLKTARDASRKQKILKLESENSECLPRLTKREREVLKAIAEGKTNRLIADELEISEHTVKLHVHRLITKLGMKNRTEAAAVYFKNPENFS